ncbi:MAG: extracellular solute-binding protein family 3 [Deltaproteobacteria bacterium]|nr:extracellular solute-binding protein family 3 [Deltaproteobacteria bacterium]
MKKILAILLTVAFVAGLAGIALAEDAYDTVKKKGVLVVGTKDASPGFGYIDPKTREIVGYDCDFAAYLAKKMGVRLELKGVTSAARIPQLLAGNIDLVIATLTYNTERAKQVDFSYTYFLTGQKFLVKKGTVKSLADLDGKKLGTAKGTTSEQNARNALPKATVVSYDDYPPAFLALQQGKVFAVTTDESILAGILGKAPNKDQYEIVDIRISDEPYGIAVAKGNPKMLKFVNDTLLEMEKNGEARKIWDKWFNPNSDQPMERGKFKITADRK